MAGSIFSISSIASFSSCPSFAKTIGHPFAYAMRYPLLIRSCNRADFLFLKMYIEEEIWQYSSLNYTSAWGQFTFANFLHRDYKVNQVSLLLRLHSLFRNFKKYGSINSVICLAEDDRTIYFLLTSLPQWYNNFFHDQNKVFHRRVPLFKIHLVVACRNSQLLRL